MDTTIDCCFYSEEKTDFVNIKFNFSSNIEPSDEESAFTNQEYLDNVDSYLDENVFDNIRLRIMEEISVKRCKDIKNVLFPYNRNTLVSTFFNNNILEREMRTKLKEIENEMDKQRDIDATKKITEHNGEIFEMYDRKDKLVYKLCILSNIDSNILENTFQKVPLVFFEKFYDYEYTWLAKNFVKKGYPKGYFSVVPVGYEDRRY